MQNIQTDSEEHSIAVLNSSIPEKRSSIRAAATAVSESKKKLKSTKKPSLPRSKESRMRTGQLQASPSRNSESTSAPSGIISNKLLTRKASLRTKRIFVKKKTKNQSSEELIVIPFKEIPESNLNQSSENSDTLQPKSHLATKTLRKTASRRQARVLKKVVSLAPKRQLDQGVNRATCSSALKSTKEECELDENSVRKACHYSYCLLHGHHHHTTAPPLKRFISLRRRNLGNQKSKRPETAKSVKKKHLVSEGSHGKFGESLGSETSPGFDAMSTTSDKTQQDNTRHIRMWRLIYHTVLAEKIGEQLNNDDQNNEGELVEDADKLLPDSTGAEGKDAAIQKMGSEQIYAIKLVEEAINGILLPEIQDQSSDDQSIIGKSSVDGGQEDTNRERVVSSDNQFLSNPPVDEQIEESEGKNEVTDVNLSGEITTLAADAHAVPEEKKISEGSREINQKAPKNWSKLKKIIVLRRFMKALDKVRELKFRENQYLPLEPNPAAENVNLRRQTTDDKKSAEEWMLDYALRQVVSNLSPSRRRKVELLIEAFETIIPTSVSRRETRSNSLNAEKHGKHVDQASKIKLNEATVVSTEVLEDQLVADDKKVIREVHQDFGSGNSETVEIGGFSRTSGLSSEKYTSPSRGDSGEISNIDDKLLSSVSARDESANKTAPEKDRVAAYGKYELQELPTPSYFSPDVNNEADETQLDKQNYFEMWRIVYNHVVSGSAAEIGNQIQVTEAVESTKADDVKILPFSSADKLEGLGNRRYGHKKNKLSQIDAIKLVEDAIDEIVLPGVQDEPSDDESITSDRDQLERVNSEGMDAAISISTESVNKSGEVDETIRKKARKTWWSIGNASLSEHHEAAGNEDIKSQKKRSNGWSNLKKFILLKRFVKALEKVDKFNPREPQYLPLQPDAEAEEIKLKHQTSEERLNNDEWMVDRALQQVVAKLTPARKRRVELLVEAFETVETVFPLSENKYSSKQGAAEPSNPKPIQTRIWPPR